MKIKIFLKVENMKHAIRGRDYIKQYKDFKLLGRHDDLERISSILMRHSSNSLLLVGPAGVGTSALILGLQASKYIESTPFDIKSKRFLWLDVDSLFSSGEGDTINKDFQYILRRLEATSESVLIIENTFNFIEAARNTGNSHFINALSSSAKKNKIQVILEVRDEQLSQVIKWHNDIVELFTLYDVREPVGNILEEIVRGVSKGLEEFHKIRIDESAIKEAIHLTSKYREGFGLGGAQPSRSISLLDLAYSSYRQHAHKERPLLAKINASIEAATNDKEKLELEEKRKAYEEWWSRVQAGIAQTHSELSNAQELLFEEQDRLDAIKKKDEERAERAANAPAEEGVQKAASFDELLGGSTASPESTESEAKIRKYENIIKSNREEHDRLVKAANEELMLTEEAVTLEFSKVSGVPADKLNHNELETLRNLENNLLKRIFGQDEVVKHIANAIKVSRIDTMKESGPAASFMLLGPSGTGKTEIAKALAENLMGSEAALIRFDMSEYMEKHAVAKLIGAPPGYEGFEAGGILTNLAKKNPVAIYLFDEAEKAHPDVFNILLQILSDGRLTDNIGRTVDFSDAIIILTSNIGQSAYLDLSLTHEEAVEKAKEELEKFFRSELLNRFNGRENILHFRRLIIEVINRIIKREIKKMSDAYAKHNLKIDISDETIVAFCLEHYDPVKGARGLPGYIKVNLRPIIVDQILYNPGVAGTFKIGFSGETKNFTVEFQKD